VTAVAAPSQGPWPRESLDRLLALEIPTHFIAGNGDREVLARMAGIETAWYRAAPEAWREPVRWTAEQPGPQHRRQMERWPPAREIEMPGAGKVLFCHATPRNDTDIFTRLTPEERLLPVFAGVGASTVVCGHTHMQFERMIGGVRVVNAGSVGMPFGEPGADWLLLGTEIELRHTGYDLASAAQLVRQTAYPQAEEFAARSILRPPSEREMLAAYARAEVKHQK
jgi:predicted phosphodiesterase